MIRAKFRVTAITEQCWGQGKMIKMEPQYDESIPEDQRFVEATPTGELEIFVQNEQALDELQLGEYFYLDFTKVAE